MSPVERNFKRVKRERSLIDGLSTKIVDKDGKVIFNGMDGAGALIKKVDPLLKRK